MNFDQNLIAPALGVLGLIIVVIYLSVDNKTRWWQWRR